MPIYEYECSQCRYYLEVMQKISDAKLRKCPSCGKNALQKLISAPVFRLKGSGWYETDFKSDQDRKRNLAGAEKDEAPADPKGTKDSKDSADGKSAGDGKDAKSGATDSAGGAKAAPGDAKGESATADKGKKADKTPERAPSRSARGTKKSTRRAPAKTTKPKSRPRGRR
jgi:putative FmdB family regulatory protein